MVREELEEFLQNRDGGLGVFLTIDRETGNTHTEFERQVDVSKVTVGKRLEEAVDIGIFERDRLPDDHGNAKRYVLTEEGERLRFNLSNHQLKERYDDLQESQAEVEKGIRRALSNLDFHNIHD
jgi:DNA-binding MarR family transcriptional regulator